MQSAPPNPVEQISQLIEFADHYNENIRAEGQHFAWKVVRQ
jgi:hypothetical protein